MHTVPRCWPTSLKAFTKRKAIYCNFTDIVSRTVWVSHLHIVFICKRAGVWAGSGWQIIVEPRPTYLQTRHCHVPPCDPARRGISQTWNWVIGSPGRWVIWVIFHVRVTGSSFWPGVRPEFFRFSKNAQNAKRTFEMLKWQKSLSGVRCWTEIAGCQSYWCYFLTCARKPT